VPGADEKCGYGLLLKTFLNQLKSPVELKQTTFHGHRINLFSMSASGFFFLSFFIIEIILKNLLKYILTKKIEID
jgi:hypothetical protein